MKTDIVIVGGGIVGLATAWQISKKFPKLEIAVLEKESHLAAHQTGHNSGVLHTGMYYKPGSLKAKNCRTGKLSMQEFCKEYGIPHDICGKVIVATDENEIPSLNNILERGTANGVKCEKISKARLRELEPHCAGIEAIHVPEAGIVNYRSVCEKLGELIEQDGKNKILLNTKVDTIKTVGDEIITHTDRGVFQSKYLINCAGLYSDHIAQIGGQKTSAKIIPFRGEYFELTEEAKHLCKNLIYPVPDPSFPFLGVHFTRMIDNSVECGPNAVLAFAREGYGKLDINIAELLETLYYPGFQKLASKYWKTGLGEMWRSFSKRAFVKALQKLVPEIEDEHLVAAPGGIRAQAVAKDGSMVDDFLILNHGKTINVCNAPSPAATSSLSIGYHITAELEKLL